MLHDVIAMVHHLLAVSTARAVSITQYDWTCDGFLYCGRGQDAVSAISQNLLTTVAAVIVPIAVLVFLYGGIRMIISRGDEGKETGKKALLYAGIGLILALMTGAIVAFVTGLIYLVGS